MIQAMGAYKYVWYVSQCSTLEEDLNCCKAREDRSAIWHKTETNQV